MELRLDPHPGCVGFCGFRKGRHLSGLPFHFSSDERSGRALQAVFRTLGPQLWRRFREHLQLSLKTRILDPLGRNQDVSFHLRVEHDGPFMAEAQLTHDGFSVR